VNSFSNEERVIEGDATAGVRPVNLAAKIQALAEEFEVHKLISRLDDIYELAGSLTDERYTCRRCTHCCDQRLRPLAVYAVEVAYMLDGPDQDSIPAIDPDEPLCPALRSENSCRYYETRPLGCRLFLPWRDWSAGQGCDNYPHSPGARDEIHYMLNMVERVNHDFIRTLGLHRDFEFDYLCHSSVSTWFERSAAHRAGAPLWGIS